MSSITSADRLTVGNVELLVITDAEATLPIPLDQLFPAVEPDRWAPYRELYPAAFAPPNHLRERYGGTLVRSGGRTILVDTGVGPDPIDLLGGVPGTLLDAIRGAGVSPEEIDSVFLTHAHIDHIGWNTDREGTPIFPRARYLLHRADWDAAAQLEAVVTGFGVPPYVDLALRALEGRGVLDLLEGESPLTPEVTAIHTPGHMSLLIASGGEKAIISGDVLVTPAQVSEPDWVFGVDVDGAQAVVTRSALLDRIEAEGTTVASCHFPHPGFGRVIRLEGHRYWRAV